MRVDRFQNSNKSLVKMTMTNLFSSKWQWQICSRQNDQLRNPHAEFANCHVEPCVLNCVLNRWFKNPRDKMKKQRGTPMERMGTCVPESERNRLGGRTIESHTLQIAECRCVGYEKCVNGLRMDDVQNTWLPLNYFLYVSIGLVIRE